MRDPWSPAQVAAVRMAWANRHLVPTSYTELGRKYGRCRKTIRRVIGGWDPTVPSGYAYQFKAGNNAAIAPRLTNELIAHAKTCETNTRIREIMEAPR